MKLPENTHILSDAAIPEGAFVVQRTTMAREKKLYEEAGAEPPMFEILLPFETNYETFFNVSALDSIGVNAKKFAAQCDQLLKENLGNNLKARIKNAAAATPSVLLDQSALNDLYSSYDFSGIRTKSASSEDDLTDEEIEIVRQIRITLKEYLRKGLLIAGMPKLTIQKVKDSEKGELPGGAFPLTAFDEMVEAAASRDKWSFDWTNFKITVRTEDGPAELHEYEINWGAEPRFSDDGHPLNPAAIIKIAEESARAIVATQRANAARLRPAVIAPELSA
jgi:hypothetical protein